MLKSIGESGHPCRAPLPITPSSEHSLSIHILTIPLQFIFLLSGPCISSIHDSPVFPVHSCSSQCIHEFLPVYSIESLFVVYKAYNVLPMLQTSLRHHAYCSNCISCALFLSETILIYSYTVISFSS